MDNPYSKAPLDLRKKQIRLVKLEHSSDSEPIRCTLRCHTLNEESPAYIALSYAWGTKDRYDDILLNGVLVPVGRSLWSFLHQMRLQHQYITIWIDALSINQANVHEQNHQVQMMRQIYGSAHSVWVWLGEADHVMHSDVAMHFLRTRKEFHGEDVKSKTLWSPPTATAVLALFERNYWKRIWIVQEIMLAKKVTVFCGTKQASWVKLEDLYLDLLDIRKRGRAFHTTAVFEVLETPARTIIDMKSTWSGLVPFKSVLTLFGNQESTDIRDKVYALHGLASDSATIRVDYDISPKALLVDLIYHVCTSSAERSTSRDPRIDLLRFAMKMNEILKIHCSEDELIFHISVARGEGIEEYIGLKYAVTEQSQIVIHPEDIARYQEPFHCLNGRCSKSFRSVEARMEHMQIHMEEAKQMLGPNLENLEIDWKTEDEA